MHGKRGAYLKKKVLLQYLLVIYCMLMLLLLLLKANDGGKKIRMLSLKATIDRVRRLTGEYSDSLLQTFSNRVEP